VEKIAAVLLPPIKIRFIKNIVLEKSELKLNGIAIPFDHPQRGKEFICVCLPIENLKIRSKQVPGFFLDVLAHELAHADPEVFKNPQHNPHLRGGHDKI